MLKNNKKIYFYFTKKNFYLEREIMEKEKSENQMLFKNVSKMNEDEIVVFQNYALKKTIILSSALLIGFCALIGVGICFAQLYLGVAVIIAGALGGGVLMPFLMKDSVKKQNKLIFGEKKYLNHFEFYNDYLMVTSESTTSKESNDYQKVAEEKVLYSDLFQVVLYKTYMFIYINKSQSFVLNQRGMTLGTVGELVPFLKEKGLKIVDKSSKVDESKIISNKKKA